MLALAVLAGAVEGVAYAVTASSAAETPGRDAKHVVYVLADPGTRSRLQPVAAAFASSATGSPVRVVYAPSARVAALVRDGEPADVVLVAGNLPWRRVRGELQLRIGPVIRPETRLGAVTDLGVPFASFVASRLPAPAAPR
jgi:hypothetical protein